MSDALLNNWKPADEREKKSERKHNKRVKAKGATRGASKPQPKKDYRPLLVKLALLILVLTSLAATGIWIRHQQLQNFTIRSIEITGSREFVTSEQVSEVLQQHAEGDFFNINIDVARDALLALPWVREVSLRREWPDRLLIKLREQQAVAHWGAGDRLLNEQGQSFAGAGEIKGVNLPSLTGPEGSQQRVLAEYVQMKKLLSTHELQALSLDARNTWEMVLQGNIQVRFLERNKDEAIQRLLTALRVFNADELKQAAKIDLRYSNGFAIEWSNEVKAKVEKGTHV
jgi:cell division protein FtsQ